jgi:hypothetical protein
MALTVDDVLAISRSVAAEFGETYDIAGVASNQVDAGRVELLVTRGGRAEPTRVLLNLERNSRSAFEKALRAKLEEALTAPSA